MAQCLFIAHSRLDAAAVAELVADARALDYSVVLDDELPGGDTWWQAVLGKMEHADAFVYAVSADSLDSEACKAQHRYAEDLGLPSVPVVVGGGVADALVPPDLARLQRVDYREASRRQMAALYRAIEGLPPAARRPATRPGVPGSVEADVRHEAAAAYLEPARLIALVRQLETLADAGVAPGDLQPAITALRERDDLTVKADQRLTALVDRTGGSEHGGHALTSDPPGPGDERAVAAGRPRRIFVSYSRADVHAVSTLAADLRAAGFEVWLDQELPGGMEWWEEVLARIRQSDAFVIATSETALASRACHAELEYARDLGKPVLAVAVGDAGEQHAALAGVTACEYREPAKDRLAAIISSFHAARTPPLPDPLPAPPPVPATYLFDIRSQIRAPQVLRPDEQMAIVEQLERYQAEDVPRRDIAQLVGEMRDRDDLTVPASRALDALHAGGGAAPAPAEPAGAPQPPRRRTRRARTPKSSPPPAPAPTAPPPTASKPARPRRWRRGVAVVGALAALAAAGGIGLAASSQDGGTATTTTRFTPGPTPTTFVPAPAAFSGIDGETTARWITGGVEYAAALAVRGASGTALVRYFNGAAWVDVAQALRLVDWGDGWAEYAGSDPTIAGLPAATYVPDNFVFVDSGAGWYVDEVCSQGFCSPAG